MANPKEYAYYVVGNQIGIVEKDVNFDNDPNSKDYGPGVERNAWKSPLSSVADALKIEYVYSPKYHINELTDKTTTINRYYSAAGFLTLNVSTGDDFSASPESFSAGSYFVLKNAGRWNGLHKVASATGLSGGTIVTDTLFVGEDSSNPYTFEETVQLYYNVSTLSDESDIIDLPPYLSKALVYYVKGKLAEDMRDIEAKEYYTREFRKMVERHQSSLIKTGRFISSGAHAVR